MKKQLLTVLAVLFLSTFAARAQSVVFEGELKIVIFEDGKETERLFLETRGGLVPVSAANDKLLNRKVLIEGELNKSGVLIPKKIEVLQPSAALAIPVAGARTTLALLLNFTNDQSQPVSPQQVRDSIFTGAVSADAFYREVSGNRLRLVGRQRADGDVTNWLTLPLTNENCQTMESNQWTAAADNLAAAQGFDTNLYQTVIYVFANPPGCINAFSTVGEIGDLTTRQRVWTPATFPGASFAILMAHEIGHNLGLQHASAYQDCPPSEPFESCRNPLEYGDPYDIMANTSEWMLFNNYHRLQLGWTNGKTAVFDAPGVYYLNLLAPSNPTKGVTTAKIRLKNASGNFADKSIFLEFRRNSAPPYDNFSPFKPANRGVSIRFGSEDIYSRLSRPYLIRAMPSNMFALLDAPLLSGNTYTNFFYGISVTTLSANPVRGARIKIELTR